MLAVMRMVRVMDLATFVHSTTAWHRLGAQKTRAAYAGSLLFSPCQAPQLRLNFSAGIQSARCSPTTANPQGTEPARRFSVYEEIAQTWDTLLPYRERWT
jgi:hypothetical protein